MATASGKERKDPSNVKYDTPTKDYEDSPDWAPGYYDDKGGGGSREVASWKQSNQVKGKSPGSAAPDSKPGDLPEGWKPEEAEDPTQPKTKGPQEPDIPDFKPEANSPADKDGPNQEQPTATANIPDNHSRLAGMEEPVAPPHSSTPPGASGPAVASTDHAEQLQQEEVSRPGERLAKEGKVKAGQQPAQPAPEEAFRYK